MSRIIHNTCVVITYYLTLNASDGTTFYGGYSVIQGRCFTKQFSGHNQTFEFEAFLNFNIHGFYSQYIKIPTADTVGMKGFIRL